MSDNLATDANLFAASAENGGDFRNYLPRSALVVTHDVLSL